MNQYVLQALDPSFLPLKYYSNIVVTITQVSYTQVSVNFNDFSRTSKYSPMVLKDYKFMKNTD